MIKLSHYHCILYFQVLSSIPEGVESGDEDDGEEEEQEASTSQLPLLAAAASGVVGAVRRLLAEKARCRRAAVVDRFRIRPFIFCIENKKIKKEEKLN